MTHSKRPKHVTHVYKQNSALSKIRQHAQLLEQMNHLFQQQLPAQFSAHCKLANIHDKTLIIHTDNASYSSLLRFQAPSLCQSLSQKLGIDINTIDVKVRPHYRPFEKQSTNPLSLPTTAAEALVQTAESMSDGPLKTALEKLAKRRASQQSTQQDD